MQEFRAGVVTLVGRPNVGKSTLLNRLVNLKVAIVSPKAQTTRSHVRGVRTTEETQMVLLDTPGIHRPRNHLGVQLARMSEQGLQVADVVLLLLAAHEKLGPGDAYIFNRLRQCKAPILLALNKVDRIKPAALLPLIDTVQREVPFRAIVPISALVGSQVDVLCKEIEALLPVGPPYYEQDVRTDQSERQLIEERIREQILLHTQEEIPHAVAVCIDAMSQAAARWDIRATIYVERESQKGIIIGKQGAMLQKVGRRARLEAESLLGAKVHLELWVKVKKDWRRAGNAIRQLGLDG